MILEIFGTILVLMIAYLYRNFYLLPKRTIESYYKAMTSKGYRVRYTPYNPLYNHLNQVLMKPCAQGDSLKIYRQEYPKYDVIVSNIMNNPIIELCHPDFVKDYYSLNKHYSFPKQKKQQVQLIRFIGLGLALSQGEHWKRKRNILNHVFNFQFIKAQTKKIAQICDHSMTQIEKKVGYSQQNGQKYTNFNILDLTSKIFSKVILKSFINMDTQQKIDGIQVAVFLKTLVDDTSDDFQDFIGMMLGINFLKLGLRKRDRYMNRNIQLYRQWGLCCIRNKIKQTQESIRNNQNKKQPSDIIQALLIYNIKNKGTKNYSPITQQQVFDEFTTFFFAGTDTTSNFTQMMIYYIALNPEVQRKLREQINTYMKEDSYTYQNLKNFTYIDNIQKEVTRMYGPATFLFFREAKEDNIVNGISIKKGTWVTVNHQGNHYSEQYFKNPLQFRPQRWETQCDDIPPFVVGGFSFGARTCIGKHLALLQNKIFIIKFMKRYRQIILPKKDIKMDYKFLPCPEIFNTKLILSE